MGAHALRTCLGAHVRRSRARTCERTHSHMHAHTHTRTHTRARLCTHAYKHYTRMHSYAKTHIYTHMLTHAYSHMVCGRTALCTQAVTCCSRGGSCGLGCPSAPTRRRSHSCGVSWGPRAPCTPSP